MKALLHVVLPFIAFATALPAEPYHATHERPFDTSHASVDEQARMHRVRTYMNTVIFPKVSFSDVTMREAIDWVTRHTAQHASASVAADSRGISTVSRFRSPDSERVTLSLHSVTLPQVLDAICAQHDYVWCVETYVLSISPHEQAPK